MQDETYQMLNEHPEPEPADHDRPLTYQLRSTQTDHELRAIEWIVTILAPLPHETQVRALTYIRDRVESDHRSLSESEPRGADVPATSSAIAQVLAESDGRDWNRLTAVGQSPYFRRAQALFSAGLA